MPHEDHQPQAEPFCCAGLGHANVSVFMSYCQHKQRWSIHTGAWNDDALLPIRQVRPIRSSPTWTMEEVLDAAWHQFSACAMAAEAWYLANPVDEPYWPTSAEMEGQDPLF